MNLNATKCLWIIYLLIIFAKSVSSSYKISEYLSKLFKCNVKSNLMQLEAQKCQSALGPGCARFYFNDTYHIANIKIKPPDLNLKIQLIGYGEEFSCNFKGCGGPGGILQFEWRSSSIKLCSIHVEAYHLDPGETLEEQTKKNTASPKARAGFRRSNQDSTMISWLVPMLLLMLVAISLAQVSNKFVKNINMIRDSKKTFFQYNPVDLYETFSRNFRENKKIKNKTRDDFVVPKMLSNLSDENEDNIQQHSKANDDDEDVERARHFSDTVPKVKSVKKHKKKFRTHKDKKRKKSRRKHKEPKAGVTHVRRKLPF